MLRLKPFLILFLLLATTATFGQQIINCEPTKSYWVINKDLVNYTVRLKGKCQATGRPNVILVNDYALQYLIVDKKNYLKDNTDNNDLNVMINYAMNEAEYLSGQFKVKLNLKMQKSPLSQDKEVLIWYYEMPSGMNQQVKFQLFANIIMGDKIIGFSSPQLSDQKFENVRDFLMDIMSTLKTTNNIKGICD